MNYLPMERNTAPPCFNSMKIKKDQQRFGSHSYHNHNHNDEPVSPTPPTSQTSSPTSPTQFYMSPKCVMGLDSTSASGGELKRTRTSQKPSAIPYFTGLPEAPLTSILNDSDNDDSPSQYDERDTHTDALSSLSFTAQGEDDEEVSLLPLQKKLRFMLPEKTKKPLSDSISSSESDAWWYPEDEAQEQAQEEEVDEEEQQDEDDSVTTLEMKESYWYNKRDIVEFHKEAKEQVRNFRSLNQDWIRNFIDDICLDPTSKANSKKPASSLKRLLKVYQPPSDYNAVRGLHIDTCLVAHRKLHCQRVLMIQSKLLGVNQTQDQKEYILKSTSLQTSKSSKTLARWFAHYDYIDMIKSIKQELSDSEKPTLVTVEGRGR